MRMMLVAYTTEFGRTLSKKELRAVFRARPVPQRRTLVMRAVVIRSRGGAAVLVYELWVREDPGIERYRVTDSYWQRHGGWRLVASHVVRVAEDLDLEADSVGETVR
jgi:hypothetical protein